MTKTSASAPALSTASVRESALAYNRAYLARLARFENVDIEAVEADIASGDVVVICGYDTHSGTVTVFAAPVVRLPAGSPLGEYAHIGDVVEADVRLPRQMPSHKAGEWWARKHFGTSLPIERIDAF